MSTRSLLGTVVGGVVLLVLGYALYGVLLTGFFQANAGTATGVNREPMNFVALTLGQLAWGAALTAILAWKGASTPADGAATGAIAGALVFLGFDLTLYGTTNVQNLTASLVDAAVATVLFAVTGAVIAMVTGKKVAA
jgi:hypothetical protein